MFEILLFVLVAVLAVLGLALGGAAMGGLLVARELTLFLKAPRFYVQRLLGGPSRSKRAAQIASRIRGLIPPKTALTVLPELAGRVERIPAAVRRMEEQREAIVLYLEYDIYNDEIGKAVGEHDRAAVKTLETRRDQLETQIEESLTTLKRIESRVASVVLGAGDSGGAADARKELEDTLEDLDVLIDASKGPALLG